VARKGQTYYLPKATRCPDVTGHEVDDIQRIFYKVDEEGNIVKDERGLPQWANPNTGGELHKEFFVANVQGRWHGNTIIDKPKEITLPALTPVQYIRSAHNPLSDDFYGYGGQDQAMVTAGDRTVVVPFPLWTEPKKPAKKQR